MSVEADGAATSKSKIDWGDYLTTVAFFLVLALVIARVTMLEILRDPFGVSPGMQASPRGPGPVATIVLDLLCCIPAMLVLLRRAIDRTYFIRFAWGFVPLFALAIWAMLSTFWASDRFASMVGSLTWASAIALMWSAAQLVRSWLRLRVVAAVCVGLLAVLIAVGITYRFIDLPDLKADWVKRGPEILKEKGWTKADFAAQQFERKVLGGELAGFSASPNSYAAIIVLCCVIAAGFVIQRHRDGLPPAAAVVPALLIALGFWMIFYTQSRTAFATPVIAAGMLLVVWKLGPWLRLNARRAYVIGAALVVVIAALVIAHGMMHGTLVHVSLTFRWRYWVGAMRLLRANPLTGVGWDNFGLFYTSARLPIAAEEVKDPHNFIVRMFAELGVVGGLLTLAWLARMAWEATRPIEPTNVAKRKCPANAVVYFLSLGAVGLIVLNVLAAIDFSSDPYYVLFEGLKRVLWVLVFVLGALSVTLTSLHNQDFDERPAPWLLYAMLVAVAVFFVHNLIDFSMFEYGPMFLFAMVVGAVIGVRLPMPATRPRQRKIATSVFAVALLAIFTVVIVILVPVADAEQYAVRGDEAVRRNQLHVAAQDYDTAAKALPLNSDYAYRAATVDIQRDSPADDVRARLGQAISVNPMKTEYYLMRARYEMRRPPEDRNLRQIEEDFRRAVRLDPNSIPIRREFAQAVEWDREEAKKQYQAALDANDALAADEPKRLKEEEIVQIKDRLRGLEK